MQKKKKKKNIKETVNIIAEMIGVLYICRKPNGTYR